MSKNNGFQGGNSINAGPDRSQQRLPRDMASTLPLDEWMEVIKKEFGQYDTTKLPSVSSYMPDSENAKILGCLSYLLNELNRVKSSLYDVKNNRPTVVRKTLITPAYDQGTQEALDKLEAVKKFLDKKIKNCLEATLAQAKNLITNSEAPLKAKIANNAYSIEELSKKVDYNKVEIKERIERLERKLKNFEQSQVGLAEDLSNVVRDHINSLSFEIPEEEIASQVEAKMSEMLKRQDIEALLNNVASKEDIDNTLEMLGQLETRLNAFQEQIDQLPDTAKLIVKEELRERTAKLIDKLFE